MTGTLLSNRLDAVLATTREHHALALLMYLTAGYPDVPTTRRWAGILAASGATILELGVPFSDPIGDGPTIQRASQHALAAGMSLRGSLALAADIGRSVATPLVLMSYCNPILRMGTGTFAEQAAAAGVTGVIVPDLPIEEAADLRSHLQRAQVHLIYLLSPASTPERIARTAAEASGFIYCMALTGVTGARADLADALPDFLQRVRSLTDVPLVVGFGVSRPEHIRRLVPLADGAVVASALIDLIDRTASEARDTAIMDFVKELSTACSGS
jgi:tryptophan synthase alpha chain